MADLLPTQLAALSGSGAGTTKYHGAISRCKANIRRGIIYLRKLMFFFELDDEDERGFCWID
jgi:hypothetical protein